ncbi:MAG: hypothetical protein E5X35_14640, partial [Mesorhizobium sp.]
MSVDFRLERERLAALSVDVAHLLQSADLASPETHAGREALIEAIEDLRDVLRPEAAIAPPPPSDALAGPRGLAIVVGHTAVAQGARALSPPFPADSPATRVSEHNEYAWNTDLAMKIKALAETAGVRCEIFFRDGVGIRGAYEAVRSWGPEATIELHFNAADGRARGSLVLYGAEQSRPWAETLQKAIVRTFDRQGRSEDRGIFIPGGSRGYDRGIESVTKVNPSALIEPFFGDNASDAGLAVRKKAELARAILEAFGAFVRRDVNIPADGGGAEDGDPPPVAGDVPDVPLLRELIATYRSVTPVVQGLATDVVERLKGITLAQWIEESGWAGSQLAVQHFNFAGMKGISEVDRILREAPATKVEYRAHDGVDTYLKFAGIRDFVTGYFLFLERSPYRGWKEMAMRSPHDFIRFIGRTWAQRDGYASRVINIEQRLVAAGVVRSDGGLTKPGEEDGPALLITGALSSERIADEGATAEFLELAAALEAAPRLAPVFPVVVAQCGLESDWGRSDLAPVHANFAGIPWTEMLAEVAAPVPHPTDPTRGKFCRFLSPTSFVRAFLRRLDNDPTFAGWIDNIDDGARFAAFLGRTWRPNDPTYADKIAGILARIGSDDGGRDPIIENDDDDTHGGDGSTTLTGLVLQIKRVRAEKRRGMKERTVSTYRVFHDRRPVAGLSGMICEARGPGDNSATGRQRGARIKAGIYPMLTHAGTREIDGITAFKTFGFTSSIEVRRPPMPALRVGDTRYRAGILIHPGNGWLWSVGCMNPADDIADARSDIQYVHSRARVIRLIEGLKRELGSRFPTTNNQTIPRLTLEVIGEPPPASGDVLAGDDLDAEAYARAELAAAQATLAGDALAAPDMADLYDALATGIEAAARLGQPEDGAIDHVAASGVNLADVRSVTGETLWTAYA